LAPGFVPARGEALGDGRTGGSGGVGVTLIGGVGVDTGSAGRLGVGTAGGDSLGDASGGLGSVGGDGLGSVGGDRLGSREGAAGARSCGDWPEPAGLPKPAARVGATLMAIAAAEMAAATYATAVRPLFRPLFNERTALFISHRPRTVAQLFQTDRSKSMS
jgi:hypothetical protein